MEPKMGTYRKLNSSIGWLLFLGASVVYILTSEPTASFWDCGEYIATAFKLQVGHPPGAPFFQLLGRFFTLFAMGNTALVARMVNTMSAMSSGLTIAFLFWSITMLAKKLVGVKNELTTGKMLAIFGSGLAGALAYTFSDSFWYSAVEGEVYAMSALFTSMTFWAILRWETVADQPHSYRWIILIAYLIGLSIGVHLLNLLAIPAITFVYYFKKHPDAKWKGMALTLIISFILVAAILYGIIPEIVSVFANTEIMFVNTFGFPFNTGSIFFALLLIGLIISGFKYTVSDKKIFSRLSMILGGILVLLLFAETSGAGDFFLRLLTIGAIVGLFYSWRKRKALLNTVVLGFVFILIGYSSFLLLVIRSNADTPINENNPDNAVNLLAYLNREQYGSTPLFYGPYYNAPLIDRRDGKPVYDKDPKTGKYVITDDKKGTVPEYDPKYMTIFPRMWNNQEDRYIKGYKNWAGIKNDPDNKHIPTFGENLRFFWKYQINNMYIRYLFWNFVGRQNDTQNDYGDILHGNWISGINFIDQARLGPQTDIPDSLKSKARNTYFFLPLLFGLLGMFYQFRKNSKDGWVIMLLFLMTGLAIVVYLNQQSPQPRERDYAYAASFYAFAIWIGLSVLALYDFLGKKFSPKIAAIVSSLGVLLLVPLIMGAQNWNDHDRSHRYTALEIAEDYLNSCAPNAILFTNGDNDTFPLWYAQEVEGIRTDVRVCNLSLLNTDWYIHQMSRQAYNSAPLPFSLPEKLYRNGSHDYTFLIEQDNIKDYVEVKDLFDIIEKDDKVLKYETNNGTLDFFPTKKFRITVDSATVVGNGTVPPQLASQVTNLEWTLKRSALTKNYLMMLDILSHNNWQRPIYFVSTTSSDAYLGLSDYFQLEGLAYRLIPVKFPKNDAGQPGSVNTDAMYDNLMNKYKFSLARPGLWLNDDNTRMVVTMRNAFSRLATALVTENKLDSAAKVCDRSIELMPDRAVPYDYFDLSIAEAYGDSGEKDKAKAVFSRLLEIENQNLGYFFSFPEDKRNALSYEIRQAMALTHAIGQSAGERGMKDLEKQANDQVDLYYKMFTGGSLNP